MRVFFVCILTIELFASLLCPAMESGSPLQAYQKEREVKNAQDRLLFARLTTARSKNSDVLCEAILDLLKYSTNDKDNRHAMELINTLLRRTPEDSEAYRESVFAKGQLLARAGQKDTAKALFLEAIRNEWKNAMDRFRETLIDCGYLDEACILEFERVAGEPPYRAYRREDDSLGIFLSLMRRMKRVKPESLAMVSVYDSIHTVREGEPYKRLAKALCLSEDGKSEEAVEILTDLDETVAKYNRHTSKNLSEIQRFKNHREFRNIPLYAASILYKQGADLQKAQDFFSLFMERNRGKNKKIMASSLQLAGDLNAAPQNRSALRTFVEFILKSSWFNDAGVRKDFTPDEVSHLYALSSIDQQSSAGEHQVAVKTL